MDKQQGFSFIETFLALMLMSTTSLGLLFWQLKATKMLQQTLQEEREAIQLQNTYEEQKPGRHRIY